MARLNQWSFRGQVINSPYVRVRQMTGPYALPPLRGQNFLTMGRTGRLFVPKVTDSRVISLEIIVRDQPPGMAARTFDQLALLFADRTQGALVNILDTGPRTAQAECIGWTPQDVSVGGTAYTGVADFNLADPWLYGPTVSGNVVPNAGLAFANGGGQAISGPRTTWAQAVSGVTSGQPLLVVHGTQGYTTVLTSIADNFSTPYTWTKVDGNNTYEDLEIYIGTGGVGTSGTVTVTAPSGNIGGIVIKCTGASTAAGLLAVDVHGNTSATSPTHPALSLTPSASWEGAIMAWHSVYPNYVTYSGFPGPWNVSILPGLVYSAAVVGVNYFYLYPPSGAALGFDAWSSAGGIEQVGLIVKGTGAAVTLNITNPGTAPAEKITLDILGPLINPTITNTTNGTSVTITATVSGTKHLLVDTGAFTALNDGVNAIGSVTHTGAVPFLTLNPGLNVLQISGSGATGSTLVTVAFTPPYA